MKKKLLLTMVLICVGVLGLGMLNASAATSGTCGDNLTWTLDDSGTLTISGTGKMTDWSYASSVPWYSSRKNIETVVIDEGVTSIGNYAFYECSSLTSIEIPDSVTSIGEYAFYACSKLTSVAIPDGVANIGCGAFERNKGLTNVRIPDSVINIGDRAFRTCRLTSVTIGNSVTSIGKLAFEGCENLTSVTIPDSVTSIGESTFKECFKLTSVTIGNGLTRIEDTIFWNCYALTEVTIGNSVTDIRNGTFRNCRKLETVYYNGTESEWRNIGIGLYNSWLTDAARVYFAYVTIYDKDGNKVVDTTQNMGGTVDTSSIMVPNGYVLKLYKDEAMTKEYSIETPIEKNLVLYANTVVSVTVDGEEREVNGQIVLGAENTDGSYSLPDNVVGYYVNDDFVDAGKYDVSDGDIITTVKFNVDVLLGAQVRYGGGVDANGKVGKGNGLRFIAQVDRSNFDGEGYGMKIEAEGSSVFTEIDAVKWQNAEETVFSVAITDMAVSNYNRNFTATPYVKVKYTDGTEKTVYGTKSVTRSIYYVATGLLKNGVNEEDYTLTGNASLYNVLNAYVNMVGVRLNLYSDGTVTANTEKEGKYTGEAFFDVECVKNGDVYSVTVTPIKAEFANPVTIKDYWKEFVRINNNNSAVKEMIENENVDENGVLTFEFKVK